MTTRHLLAWTLGLSLSGASLAWAEEPSGPACDPAGGGAAGQKQGGPGTQGPGAAGAGERPGRGPGGPGAGPGGPRDGGFMLAALADQLQLTQDQKAQWDKVVAEHRTQIQAAVEANKDKMAEIRQKIEAARDAQDREALRAAMEEGKALADQNLKPLMEQTFTQLRAILTPEQQTKLDELKAKFEQRGPGMGGPGGRPGVMFQGALSQLDLTPEQRQQVDAAMANLRQKMQAAEKTPEARQPIMEEFKATLQSILTPEQQAKLEELRAKHEQGGFGPGGGPGGGQGKGPRGRGPGASSEPAPQD